jgi:NADH dehydrogenase/NADH:ubiquinone oxidoreductase subunit G
MPSNNMVTLTIDGQEVKVPKGTKVMPAADSVDIYIPRFCYHGSLSVLGACRICLVQVFTPVTDRNTGEPVMDEQTGEPQYREMPTLQTACTLDCSEGMRVVTDSEKVIKGRENVIEFILANHPLDCPICDKGGECELQEMTMICGPPRQLFTEPRLDQDKARRIGASIVLDQERCIVCFRCTRFLDEWASEQVFEFHERGGHDVIEPALGEPIEKARFAGNTIDICPVGALTSEYFRFSARPWELADTPGVCPHCAVGCSLTLGGRLGTLARVEPRSNYYINDIWICDKGRYDYEWVQGDRIVAPEIAGESQAVDWPVALDEAVKVLSGSDRVAAVVDPGTSCETGYLTQVLVRDGLGLNSLHVEDEFDLAGPFSGTVMDLMYSDPVLLISANILDDQPILWLRLNRRHQEGKTNMIAIGPTDWAPDQKRLATDAADLNPGREVALIQGLSELVRERSDETMDRIAADTGIAADWLGSLLDRLTDAKRPAVVVGRLPEDQYGPAREAVAKLIDALQEDRKMPIRGGILVGGANSRGLRLVGCSAAALPGGRSTDEPVTEDERDLDRSQPKPWREALLAGELEALLVVGGDPFADASLELIEAARGLSGLIYVGTNHNATAELATVTLAAASFAEESLTYVNFEGRLQQSVPTNDPIERTRPTFEILGRLCAALGQWQGVLTADAVRMEMGRRFEGLGPWMESIGEQGEAVAS